MKDTDGKMMQKIDRTAFIGERVQLGKNVRVKAGCIIEDDVTIQDDTYIDYHAVIRKGTQLGERSYIGAGCIIGEHSFDSNSESQNAEALSIGTDAVIRSGSVIYGHSVIGEHFQTGHHVTVREHTQIGDHVNVGTLSDIEGYCEIGDYVRMHSNVHIGQKSKIGNYVWIFPYVVLTNDPTPPSNVLKGVTLEPFAVISTGAILLPGVVVEKDSLVAAGAIVTKDVYTGEVVAGNPAKKIADISSIKDRYTGQSVYPWRYTFKRGMPWEYSDFQTFIDMQQK